MKNLVVTLIIAFAVMASYSQATAQYAIPSFDVPVYVNTTFEGDDWVSNNDNSREERKLKVRVDNSSRNAEAWVLISVYKVGSPFAMGPFKVKENQIFTKKIDDGNWGVKVLGTSGSCLLSVWDE